MILKRISGLFGAVRSLKKGDLTGFAKFLGISVKPAHKRYKFDKRTRRYIFLTPKKRPSRKKRLNERVVPWSNLWLEYNFGWVPLYQDIYNSCQVLGQNPPDQTLKGVGYVPLSNISPFLADSARQKVTYSGRIVCKMQAKCRISSPNLLLLNHLGLINPAYVLWDAIPLSFVIDWFLPVGKFLQSWTDFVGLELYDAFTSTLWDVQEGCKYEMPSFGGYNYQGGMKFFTRRTGTREFYFRPSFRLSGDLWKLVTSLSLLSQSFAKSFKP
jgi:hypothetical protein